MPRQPNIYFVAWKRAIDEVGMGIPKKGSAAYTKVRAVYNRILQGQHPTVAAQSVKRPYNPKKLQAQKLAARNAFKKI